LAEDYQAQVAHLNSWSVDELVRAFDDLYKPVRNWYAELDVPAEAVAALADLDHHLESFSDAEADLWTLDALKDAEEWRAARELATTALAHLGVK
jgi:hypothetical protein